MGGACTTAKSHDPTSSSDRAPAGGGATASVHQGSGLKTIRAMRTTTDSRVHQSEGVAEDEDRAWPKESHRPSSPVKGKDDLGRTGYRVESKGYESLTKNEVEFSNQTLPPPQPAEKDNENDDGLATEIAGGTSNTCRNRSATSACFDQSSMSHHDATNTTKYNNNNTGNNTSNVGRPKESPHKPLVAFGTHIPESSTGRAGGVPAVSHEKENDEDVDRGDHDGRARFVVVGGTEVQPLLEDNESGKKRRGMAAYYEETYRPSRKSSDASSTPTKNSEITTKGSGTVLSEGAHRNHRYPRKSQSGAHPNIVQQSTEDEDEDEESRGLRRGEASSSSAHDGIEGREGRNKHQSDRQGEGGGRHHRHLSIASDDGTEHTVDVQSGVDGNHLTHSNAKDSAALLSSKAADSLPRAAVGGAEHDENDDSSPAESSQRPSEVLKMSVSAGGPPRAGSTTNTVMMTATTSSSEAGGVKTVTARGSTSTPAPSPHTVSHADDHAVSPTVVAHGHEHEGMHTIGGATAIRELPPHILLKKNTAAIITLQSALTAEPLVGCGHTIDDASPKAATSEHGRQTLGDERMQQQQQPAGAIGSLPPFAASSSAVQVQGLQTSSNTLKRGSTSTATTASTAPHVGEGALLGPPPVPSASTIASSSSGVLQQQLPMPDLMTPFTIVGPAFVDTSSSRLDGTSPNPLCDPAHVDSNIKKSTAAGSNNNTMDNPQHPVASSSSSFPQRPPRDSTFSFPPPQTQPSPQQQLSSPVAPAPSPPLLTEAEKTFLKTVKHHREQVMASREFTKQTEHYKLFLAQVRREKRASFEAYFNKSMVRLKEVLANPATTFFCGPLNRPLVPNENIPTPFEDPSVYLLVPPQDTVSRRMENRLEALLHSWVRGLPSEETGMKGQRLTHPALPEEFTSSFYYDRAMSGKIGEAVMTAAMAERERERERREAEAKRSGTSVSSLLGASDAQSPALNMVLEGGVGGITRSSSSPLTNHNNSNNSLSVMSNLGVGGINSANTATIHKDNPLLSAKAVLVPRPKPEPRVGEDANAPNGIKDDSRDSQQKKENDEENDTNNNNNNNAIDESNSPFINLPPSDITSDLTSYAITMPLCDKSAYPAVKEWTMETAAIASGLLQPNSSANNTSAPTATGGKASSANSANAANNLAAAAATGEESYAKRLLTAIISKSNSSSSVRGVGGQSAPSTAAATSATGGGPATSTTAQQQRDGASSSTAEKLHTIANTVITQHTAHRFFDGKRNTNSSPWSLADAEKEDICEWESAVMKSDYDYYSSSTMVNSPQYWQQQVLAMRSGQSHGFGECDGLFPPPPPPHVLNDNNEGGRRGTRGGGGEDFLLSLIARGGDSTTPTASSGNSNNNNTNLPVTAGGPYHQQQQQRPRFSLSNSGGTVVSSGPLFSAIGGGSSTSGGTLTSTSVAQQDPHPPIVASRPLSPFNSTSNKRAAQLAVSPIGGVNSSTNSSGGGGGHQQHIASSSVYLREEDSAAFAADPYSFLYPERDEDGLVRSPPYTNTAAPFVLDPSRTHYHCAIDVNIGSVVTHFGLGGNDGENESLSFGNLMAAVATGNQHDNNQQQQQQQQHAVPRARERTGTMHYLGATSTLPSISTNIVGGVGGLFGGHATSISLAAGGGNLFGSAFSIQTLNNVASSLMAGGGVIVGRGSVATSGGLGSFINFNMMPRMSIGVNAPLEISLNLASPQELLNYQNGFGEAQPLRTVQSIVVNQNDDDDEEDEENEEEEEAMGGKDESAHDEKNCASDDLGEASDRSFDPPSRRETLRGGIGSSAVVSPTKIKKRTALKKERQDNEAGDASTSKKVRKARFAMSDFPEPQKDTTRQQSTGGGGPQAFTSIPASAFSLFNFNYKQQQQQQSTNDGVYPARTFSIAGNALQSQPNAHSDVLSKPAAASVALTASLKKQILRETLNSITNPFVSLKPIAASQATDHVFCTAMETANTLLLSSPSSSFSSPPTATAVGGVVADDETSTVTGNNNARKNVTSASTTPPIINYDRSLTSPTPCADSSHQQQQQSHHPSGLPTSPSRLQHLHNNANTPTIINSSSSYTNNNTNTNNSSSGGSEPSNVGNTEYRIGGGSSQSREHRQKFVLGYQHLQQRSPPPSKHTFFVARDGDEMSGGGSNANNTSSAAVAAATNAVIRKNPLISSAISRTFDYPHPCASARYTVAALMLYNSYYTTPEALRSWLTKSANQIPAVVKPEPKPHPHGMAHHSGNPNRSPTTPQRGLGIINPRSPNLNPSHYPSPSASSSRGAAAGFPAVGRWGAGVGGGPADEQQQPQTSTLTAGGGDTGELTGSAFVPIGVPRAQTPQQPPPQQGMGWSSFTGGESSSNPPLVGPPPTSTTKSSRRAGTRVPAVTMLDEGLVDNGAGAHGGGGEHQSHASQSLNVSNSVGGSLSRSTHSNAGVGGAFTGVDVSMSSVVSGFEGGTGSRPDSRQQRTRHEGGDKEERDDDGSRAQSASPVALRPFASFHQYNPQQYHHTNANSALTSQSDLDTANIAYTYSAAPGLLSSLAGGAGVAANVNASGEFESSSSNNQHQHPAFHHYQGYGVGGLVGGGGAPPQGLMRSVASSSSQFGYSLMVMPTAVGGGGAAGGVPQQYHFNRGGALPSVRAAAVPPPSGFGVGGGSSISVASMALEMSFGGGSEFGGGGGGSLASSPYHRGSRRRGGGGGVAGSSFSSLAALQGQMYGSSSPMGSGIGPSRGGFLNQNPHSSLSNVNAGRPYLLAGGGGGGGGNEHSLVDGGAANSSSSVNYNSNFFHAGHNSFLVNTNFNQNNNYNNNSNSLSRANTSSMTSYGRGGGGGANGGGGLLFGSTARIIVLDSDAPSAESSYRGESRTRHRKTYAPSSSSASASSSGAPSPTLAAVAGGSIHAYSGGRSRTHNKKRRSSSIAVSLAGTFYTFSFCNEQKSTPQLLTSASRPQPSQLLSVNNPSHKNRLPSLATEITSKQQQQQSNPTGSPTGLDLEDPNMLDAPHPKGIPYVSQSKTTSRVASRMRRTVAEAAAISLQQQQSSNGSFSSRQAQQAGSRDSAHDATRRSKTVGQHKKSRGVRTRLLRRPAPTPVDVMQKFLGNHTTIGRPSLNPMADLTMPPPDVNKTIARLAAAAGVKGPAALNKSKAPHGSSAPAISANTPSTTPFSPSAAARGYHSRNSPSVITKSPIGPFTHQHFVVSPSHQQATLSSNARGNLLSILEASSVPPPPPPPVQPPTSHAVLPMLLPWRHLPYAAPSTLTLLLMSAGLIAERAKLIRDTRRALLKSLPLIRHLAGEKERAVVEAITCGGEYVDVDVYNTEELENVNNAAKASSAVGSARYGGTTKPSTSVNTDPTAGVFGVDAPPSLGRNGSLTLTKTENEGVVQSADTAIAAAPALNTFLIATPSRSPSLSASSANPSPSAKELSTTKANKSRSANSPSASTTADRGVNAMTLLSNPQFDQPPLMCASTSVDYGAGQSLVGGASSTGVQYSLKKQDHNDRGGSLQLFIPPPPPHFSSMVLNSNPALISPTQEHVQPPPTPPPQLLAPDVILLPEPVPAFVVGRLLPALNDKVHAMVRRRARRAKAKVKKAQGSSTPSRATIGSNQDRVTVSTGAPNPTVLSPAPPPSTLLLPPPASVTTTNTTDSSGTTERLFGRAITSLSANSTSANTTTSGATGAIAGNVGGTQKHANTSSSDLTTTTTTTTAKSGKQRHDKEEGTAPLDPRQHRTAENIESQKRLDSSLWSKVERRVFLNDPFGIVMVNARVHSKKIKSAKLRKSNENNNNNNVLNRDNDQGGPFEKKMRQTKKNAKNKNQKASRLPPDSPTLIDSSRGHPYISTSDKTQNAVAAEERATEGGDNESSSSSSSISRSPAAASSSSFAPSVYSSDEETSSSSVPYSSLLGTLSTSSSSSSIWTDGGDCEKTADASLTDPPPAEETMNMKAKPDEGEVVSISPPLMDRAPLAEVNPSIAYATTESLDAVRLPAALLGPLLLDLKTGKYVPEREALRIICRWAREAASANNNNNTGNNNYQEAAMVVSDTKSNSLRQPQQTSAAATSTPPLLPPAFALSSPAGQEAELFSSSKPLTHNAHNAPAVAEKHFAEYQQAMQRYMHNYAYEQQQMQLQHPYMYVPQPPPANAATYRVGRGSVTISLMGQHQHGAQSSTSFSLAPHFVASNNSSQLNLHHPLTGGSEGWEGTGGGGGGGVRVTSAAVGGSQPVTGPSNNRQFSVTGGLAVAGQHHPSSLLAPNPFTYTTGASARGAPMGSGGHAK